MSRRLKLASVILGALLLLSLVSPVALADPGTFVFKNPPKWAGGHRAMVTDPLVSTSGGPEYGYVRFPCQSKEGFEYSIGVKGLASNMEYTVQAASRGELIDPGTGLILPTSDGAGNIYPLGIMKTGKDGDGEVSGLVALPATHPLGLPFGIYEWDIQVLDSSGAVVLQSSEDDPVGLQVFP